jgi:DNA-binding CsgD family transcriptional regulator
MNMAMETNRRNAAGKDASPLTRREIEIVALLAQGLSNSTIAEELGIATKTVQNHMNSILAKIAPPPWADPRVYLSLWHLGESKRLRELAAGPGTRNTKRSTRKKVGAAT